MWVSSGAILRSWNRRDDHHGLSRFLGAASAQLVVHSTLARCDETRNAGATAKIGGLGPDFGANWGPETAANGRASASQAIQRVDQIAFDVVVVFETYRQTDQPVRKPVLGSLLR
jgi:hypothetical protein